MKRLIFLIGLLLLLLKSSEAATFFMFDNNCRTAYLSSLDLRFNNTRQLMASEKKINSGNLMPYYVESYVDFLTVFIGEQENDFITLKENQDIRLDKVSEGSESSPWFLFTQAEILIHGAFARVKFEEYVGAANEIRKAYKLLVKNNKKYPEFVPNKKALGLLHCLIGTIPDKYKWATDVIGMNGTVKQGYNELCEVLSVSRKNKEYAYLETECLFLMTFVELNLRNDDAELAMLKKWLSEKESSSPLLVFAKASVAMKTGNTDYALKILQSKQLPDAYPFHYLNYLKGQALARKLDGSCRQHLISFVSNFKGRNYIKSAYQMLAWNCAIAADNKGYLQYMSMVSLYGNSQVDEDKMSEKESKIKDKPNIVLLKSRLLFDGGYYSRALELLTKKKPSEYLVTSKDYAEFYYRLARIYHKTSDISKAKLYYDQTIVNGALLPCYFAANSALQMGMLFEKEGNKTKAKIYFQKCLTFKDHEYKNSIDQKAKAGLERLR